MKEFWYHSPVRFYKVLENHTDVLSPQNVRYFGSGNPYPLEVNIWHRFLIPMGYNELPEGKYKLYIVNGYQKVKINSSVFIEQGKIKHISFRADKNIEGRLILTNENGDVVFYSNCVRFIDSSDYYGRKYIRIATRNSFNRNLFDFESEGAWFITNLPAYDLGMNSIDVEVANNRISGNSTLRVKDSFIDEIVRYEILAEGDFNVLNFVNVHSVNDYLFIDGIQRTCIEKMEQDDFAMSGTIKLANVRNEAGGNILFDESAIWQNIDVVAFSKGFSGGFN